MRRTATLAGAALLVSLLPAAGSATPASPERVEHRVETAAFQYAPSEIVISQGDTLRHHNVDSDLHDLVSVDAAPNGEPWFKSPLIGSLQNALVPVENLPAGKYPFFCSIHPFMTGNLYVDTLPDGIPDPEPPPTPETPEPGEPAEVRVTTGDDFFAPQTVVVPVGTTISWTNSGSRQHSVTASDASWDSNPLCPTGGCQRPGETFRRTFDAPGVVPYFCKLHGTPSGLGHAGTVVVVPAGQEDTSVSLNAATPSGDRIDVSGGVSFGGESPGQVVGDASDDAPVPDQGIELTGAALYRPDPGIDALFVEWRVADLTEAPVPEAVRYTMPLRAGGSDYVLRVRSTGALSPAGAGEPTLYAGRATHAFELLGACEGPGGLAACEHLDWLTGSIDAERGIVRVKVPLGEHPGLEAGATITARPNPPSSLSFIQAAIDAGAATGQLTDSIQWPAGFETRIAAPEVLLGIAPSGTPEAEVELMTPASVSGSGTFTGSLDHPGAGEWDVWARACFGTDCSTSLRTVTL